MLSFLSKWSGLKFSSIIGMNLYRNWDGFWLCLDFASVFWCLGILPCELGLHWDVKWSATLNIQSRKQLHVRFVQTALHKHCKRSRRNYRFRLAPNTRIYKGVILDIKSGYWSDRNAITGTWVTVKWPIECLFSEFCASVSFQTK